MLRCRILLLLENSSNPLIACPATHRLPAQTLACRATKLAVGASKHNAFSIARFATSEEGPGGPVRENGAGKKWAGVDRDFWEGVADLIPEAVGDHKAKVGNCVNLS